MIDFLKNKGIKAFQEIQEIAERPDLLFSNDQGQYEAEARYNVYTIQKLNKLIKKNLISLNEFQQVIEYIKTSWTQNLSTYYQGKTFVFYIWGDYQIPAIRVSVVSYYERVELPFGCALNKVSDIGEVLSLYMEKARFDGLIIMEAEGEVCTPLETNNVDRLTVYLKKIIC